MHNEVVREEVVVAFDLEVVRLLRPRRFNRDNAVPIDFRASESRELWRLQMLGELVDHPASKPSFVATRALDLSHPKPRCSAARSPGDARPCASASNHG